MHVDITALLADFEPKYYAASAAEIGEDAGRITWENAVDRAESVDLLDTAEKVGAFRSFVLGFGAWTEEEVDAWTAIERNALLLQFIAGDLREGNSGRVCLPAESVDGRAYFDLGE